MDSLAEIWSVWGEGAAPPLPQSHIRSIVVLARRVTKFMDSQGVASIVLVFRLLCMFVKLCQQCSIILFPKGIPTRKHWCLELVLIRLCEIPCELCTFYQYWSQFVLERDTSMNSWCSLILGWDRSSAQWWAVWFLICFQTCHFLYFWFVQQKTETLLSMTLSCFCHTGQANVTTNESERRTYQCDYIEKWRTFRESNKRCKQAVRHGTSAWGGATTAWGGATTAWGGATEAATESRWELPPSKQSLLCMCGCSWQEGEDHVHIHMFWLVLNFNTLQIMLVMGH